MRPNVEADDFQGDTIRCRRFCSGESIQEQQTSLAFNRVLATTSTKSSYKPQISIDFNRRRNRVRDQVPYPEVPSRKPFVFITGVSDGCLTLWSLENPCGYKIDYSLPQRGGAKHRLRRKTLRFVKSFSPPGHLGLHQGVETWHRNETWPSIGFLPTCTIVARTNTA